MTHELQITFANQQFTFVTDSSLFSPKQLDLGSRLLLESISVPDDPINILDLGCGWGAVGIILARLHPNATVFLMDNDSTALFFSEKNAKANGLKNIQIRKADVTYTTLPQKFDLILSNPPWTKNRSVTPKLIEFAYNHLAPGGKFYVVINKTYRIQDQLTGIFGNTKEIRQQSSYKVLESTRTENQPNDLLPWTKDQLAQHKITPDPLKGQYFIIDSNIVNQIVSAANVKSTDTVLEIGSGLGMLTRPLAKRVKKVIAIEIDPRFRPALSDLPKNVEVIYEDFFQVFRPKTLPFKFNKIVSNVPYSAAGGVLAKLAHRNFDLAILTLPNKFGQRLLEGELKEFFEVTRLFNLPRSFFFPMPDTDSIVLKLRKI